MLDEEIVPLTLKAFDLLLVLVENSGHLLEKEELMKRVWPDSFVEEANLSNNIFTLRRSLGEERNRQKYIETVPRRGYRFVAQVRRMSDEDIQRVTVEDAASQLVAGQEREESPPQIQPDKLPSAPFDFRLPLPSRYSLHFLSFHLPSDVDLLYRDGEVVRLEPGAVRVLRYLARHPQRVISKEELLEHIWPDVFTTDAVLKKAVSQARRALGDDANDPRFIKTYHARGYSFVAPVTLSDSDAERVPEALDEGDAVVHPSVDAKSESFTNVPDYDQLVGRDAELGALKAEYGRMLEGVGQPVFISGDSGIGKTQLARYFMRWAREQGALCLSARFFDYEASRLAPYEVFLGLLRSAFNLIGSNERASSLDEATDLRAMAQAVCGVRLPEELFADVELRAGATHVRASVGAAAGDNFRAIIPVSQCFTRLSRQCPLVIVLDDLQWADEASRDVLGYLMRTASSEHLLIVILARSEEMLEPAEALHLWLKQQAHYRSFTSLKLKPLDEEACRAAIRAIFCGDNSSSNAPEVPPRDLQTLSQLTGGNPYFLTEMLRLLMAEGVIVYEEAAQPRWRWRGIKDLNLPDTLVLAAEAKLDHLSPRVREIIEHAAVIGDEFRVETLSQMSGQSETEIEDLLSEGKQLGVLSGRGLSAGEDYRFYHMILRRVLYEALPSRRRRRLHARAVETLELVHAREADRVAEALSAHAEAAEDWPRTFEWSMRAADAAIARWQWSEAVAVINRAERAARKLNAEDENAPGLSARLKLVRSMGEVYYSVGKLKEAEAIWTEAIALAREANDRSSLAVALLQQGLTRTGLGWYQKASEPALDALDIYRDTRDYEGEALSLIQLSRSELGMGNYVHSARAIEKAIALIGPEHRIATIASGRLGWTYAFQGRYRECIPLFERAINDYHSSGNIWAEAQVQQGLIWAQIGQGQYEAAIGLALCAHEVFRSAGDAFGETKTNLLIGRARIAEGLFDEGIGYLNRTLERLKDTGDAHCEAETLWMLGRAACEMGRFADAGRLLSRSLEMIRDIGDRDDECRILTDLAHLKICEQDNEGALLAANRAISIAEELDNRDVLGLALVERAQARLNLSQRGHALEEAERAAKLLSEAGSGESWRGYWILGKTLDADFKDKRTHNRERALAAMRHAVELLEAMREQLDASDNARRDGLTRARAPLARELHAMLLQSGQAQEAEKIARRWMLFS